MYSSGGRVTQSSAPCMYDFELPGSGLLPRQRKTVLAHMEALPDVQLASTSSHRDTSSS